MTEKKRGRPRKKDDMHQVWEHKYYVVSEKRHNWAIRKTVEDRLYKGYKNLFIVVHGREPNQADVRVINKAVTAIIDRI